MECAAHAGTPATRSCSFCKSARCERCLTWEVDGGLACEDCGANEEARGRTAFSALLGLASAGYLAALAVSVMVFHARPFVGGFAALVAIALWRILPSLIPLPEARRRTAGSPARVDAPGEPR